MKKYLNNSVIFTQFNQLFRGLSGIFTLILIPLFLTKKQQGYWFTMASLAALAMPAGLSFFQVTLQFAAHKFAYLKFDNNDIVGSEDHKKRLASLAPQYFFLGWLSGCLWGVPWILWIFRTKKHAWQTV